MIFLITHSKRHRAKYFMKNLKSLLLACSLVGFASASSAYTVTPGQSTPSEIAALNKIGEFYEQPGKFTRGYPNCNSLPLGSSKSTTFKQYANIPLGSNGQPDYSKMKLYSDRVEYYATTPSVVVLFQSKGLSWKLAGGPTSAITGPASPGSTRCTACVLTNPMDTSCGVNKGNVVFDLKA